MSIAEHLNTFVMQDTSAGTRSAGPLAQAHEHEDDSAGNERNGSNEPSGEGNLRNKRLVTRTMFQH